MTPHLRRLVEEVTREMLPHLVFVQRRLFQQKDHVPFLVQLWINFVFLLRFQPALMVLYSAPQEAKVQPLPLVLLDLLVAEPRHVHDRALGVLRLFLRLLVLFCFLFITP